MSTFSYLIKEYLKLTLSLLVLTLNPTYISKLVLIMIFLYKECTVALSTLLMDYLVVLCETAYMKY